MLLFSSRKLAPQKIQNAVDLNRPKKRDNTNTGSAMMCYQLRKEQPSFFLNVKLFITLQNLEWRSGCDRGCFVSTANICWINGLTIMSQWRSLITSITVLTWTSCDGRAHCTNCDFKQAFASSSKPLSLTHYQGPTFGSSWVSNFLARLQTERLFMITFFFFFCLLCLYDWLRATSSNSELAHITREPPLQCISLAPLSIYLSDCWHNLWREWKIKPALL